MDRKRKPVLPARYDIESSLGRGGFGEVFSVWDRLLEHRIAIKVLDRSAPGELIDDFRRETLMARKLAHPGLVRVFDLQEHDGCFFISMEYLGGGSLQARCQIPWPLAELQRVGRAVAEALAAMHGAGIIHRDLKPANILFDDRDQPRVADFGLALQWAVDHSMEIIGTPLYMSPEQLVGERLTPACDVYAFAVLLFELTAGRPPFLGSIFEVAQQHRFSAPPRVSELRPGVPAALDDWIEGALDKQPERRPSLQAVIEALEGIDCGRGREVMPAPGAVDSAPTVELTGVLRALISDPGGAVGAAAPIVTMDRAHFARDLLVDRLLTRDPAGTIEPGVTTLQWIDARTLQLSLRPGVRFHPHPALSERGGRAASGADIVHSIEMARRRGAPLPRMTAAAGAGGAVLSLERPAPFLPQQLFEVGLVAPEWSTWTSPERVHWPAGTGPFRATSPLSPVEPVWTLPRADDYWGERSELASVALICGDDVIEAADQMEARGYDLLVPSAHETELLTEADGAFFRLREPLRDRGLRLGAVRGRRKLATIGLLVSRARVPVAARRALRDAIDAGALAGLDSLRPDRRILASGLLGHSFRTPALTTGDQSQLPARIELACAGRETLAAGIARQLGAVGTRVDAVDMPVSQSLAAIERGDLDALLVGYYIDTSGQEACGLALETSPAFSPPACAALREELVHEPSIDARAELYRRLEGELLDDAGFIPLGRPGHDRLLTGLIVGPRLGGFVDRPSELVDWSFSIAGWRKLP